VFAWITIRFCLVVICWLIAVGRALVTAVCATAQMAGMLRMSKMIFAARMIDLLSFDHDIILRSKEKPRQFVNSRGVPFGFIAHSS
jgi:hypothetical protein